MKQLISLLARTAVLLIIAVACIVLAAILATRMAVHQVADVIRAEISARDANPATAEPATDTVDFYRATGLDEAQVRDALNDAIGSEASSARLLRVSLQDGNGNYLANAMIRIKWDAGERTLRMGTSGVADLPLSLAMLSGLQLHVPAGYTHLRQSTIPAGTAYQAEQIFAADKLSHPVVSDREIDLILEQRLSEFHESAPAIEPAALAEQLQRTKISLPDFTKNQADRNELKLLSPAEIASERRNSVVVVAHWMPGGKVSHASGVVLHDSGIIATAYHVVDKPTALARCIMTLDKRVFPIAEILAGNQSTDVALLRIEAAGLHAAPLAADNKTATANQAGAPVTVISHPGHQHFTLTQGYIGRYYSIMQFGQLALMMSVTAEFADGSSGAPVFNGHGEVAGLVSSTNGIGTQMVYRCATPSVSLRQLIGTEYPETTDFTVPSAKVP